ncbi:MAG: SMI1/KNR4 family protein, partial [Culicoidibacterales bacterium]
EERKYILDSSKDMYVIESLGIDGIIIWQNSKGEVFQTIPNGEPEKIHNSFESYLLEEVLI